MIGTGGYDKIGDTFSQVSFRVRLITLEQHLDALVHLKNIEPTDALALRKFTQPYHVNLMHMVRFDDVITAVPQAYLRRLFIRGAAVQCCHNQPVIDGFYVAYGGDLDKACDLSKFMIIAWQSKAKATAGSPEELVAGLTGPMQIDAAGKLSKSAQLVIIMDLNTKSVFMGKGDQYLQVTQRKAKVPEYTSSAKMLRAPPAPWGGYATSPHQEPETWCVNVRGHGTASYPCTDATSNELTAPDFSALFEELEPDIEANAIITEASQSAKMALQPLSHF
ncbi:hypothetical protein B0H17DRAFT_614243 [Mycena rosella]|uniref:Uncharacterized protein n=1 Tax=Mycena rosella TaxID=1033263 RepID=A0AAD7GVS3_MYCRO|nr:hypothetical protein B0H17DRAFT_614243 [Mycena rosella]